MRTVNRIFWLGILLIFGAADGEYSFCSNLSKPEICVPTFDAYFYAFLTKNRAVFGRASVSSDNPQPTTIAILLKSRFVEIPVSF